MEFLLTNTITLATAAILCGLSAMAGTAICAVIWLSAIERAEEKERDFWAKESEISFGPKCE